MEISETARQKLKELLKYKIIYPHETSLERREEPTTAETLPDGTPRIVGGKAGRDVESVEVTGKGHGSEAQSECASSVD